MPELPEIHNYSFIINKNCKDKVFTEVKDPTRKFEIPFKYVHTIYIISLPFSKLSVIIVENLQFHLSQMAKNSN